MLNIVVLDTNSDEEFNISSLLKTAYAKHELPIKSLTIARELSSILQDGKDHMARCNVFVASLLRDAEGSIEFAQSLRRGREDIFIVFVADQKTDIAACVRPSVRPAGVLFIPLEKFRIYKAINEIYEEHTRMAAREVQPVFKIKTGGEYYSLNTGDISFFEAKGKKIAVKTKGQEILFYSNFDTILENLPEWFVRCHKGFVVNTKQIFQTSFTDMTVTLKDKCTIPISRTYRSDVKTSLDIREV